MMFAIRYGRRHAAEAFTLTARPLRRCYASKISIPFAPPPFPVVETCPSPTCACRSSPPGLEIDRDQNLSGTMAAYATQVLISTGQDDWKSRIEEDEGAVLVRQLKKLIGRGGKYSDPYNNVLITNTSFAPSASRSDTSSSSAPPPSSSPPSAPASAFILPTFDYLPSIPTDAASVEAFVRAYLLPTREQQQRAVFAGARRADELLVLVCGHGGRDARCGVLGPLLRAEFAEQLARQGVRVLEEDEQQQEDEEAAAQRAAAASPLPAARVGLISHIGGHKFAGNVIVYVPPTFAGNALRGKGIWYGRVGPEHVEGIVAQTLLGGKVIRDMFRGGIDQTGEILRL